jgi:CheY-like chemotaxis protein
LRVPGARLHGGQAMIEDLPLAGLRILVVEDDMVVALAIEQALKDLGAACAGPALSVDHALRLAQEEALDGALLDLDLRGTLSFGVADALEARGVPVVFATGYDQDARFPTRFADHPRLGKPYSEQELKQVALARFARSASDQR